MKILCVEDDPWFGARLQKTLSRFGSVDWVAKTSSALLALEETKYQLAVIDMQLDSEDSGSRVLDLAQRRGVYSIVLSQHDHPSYIKRAYQLGCRHYLTKDRFEESVDFVIQEFHCAYELEHFLRSEFLTEDPSLLAQLKDLSRSFFQKRPILILGETGVGKGAVAELIHRMNRRSKESFVAINTSAIPEHLIESELFGYAKGAFTGAVQKRDGKLLCANGGTLFLDECATMSVGMQKKLLKVLEEKSFVPIGSNTPLYSDFHLVTATCEDLYLKVKEGSFRTDLFHRINSTILTIPPLRERKGDIPLLIHHFLKKSSRKIYLSEEAMDTLSNYQWSGNVRELRAVLDYLMTRSGIVTPADLPPQYFKEQEELLSDRALSFIKEHGINRYIERIELEAISKALRLQKGLASKAIQMLKMSRSTFYRILEREQLSKDSTCYA